MECLSQAWSIVPCLWECSAKHSAYTTNLQDNLISLKMAMDELNNRSEDVKNRVNQAEEQQMKRTHEVNGLLDDIWERLELSEVGIPQPSRDNMSKVIFTTRSRQVCRSMDAHELIEVSCLPPDQAFSLFCSKVGEDVIKYHQDIKGLIKDVASECQGLPLALISIGRAMKGKTDAQQWKDAKRTLEKYTSTFPGTEGQVFSKLVFSYDNLPTPTLVLTSATGIRVLLDSHKVQSRTSRLKLKIDEPLPDVLDLGTEALTKRLERLEMDYCQMSVIKLGRPSLGNNIRQASFIGCHNIQNLNSLVYVSNLCILEVGLCSSMEELIGQDAEETDNVNISLFSCPASLITLWSLRKLRSICPQSALPFPCLESLRVYDCSSLRKLPLDSNTASTTPPNWKIQGKRGWWDGLHWDTQATHDYLTPKFVCS